jgi:hypothetical protein
MYWCPTVVASAGVSFDVGISVRLHLMVPRLDRRARLHVKVFKAFQFSSDDRAEPSPRPSPGVPGEGEEKGEHRTLNIEHSTSNTQHPTGRKKRWAVPALREGERGKEGHCGEN